MSNKRGIQGLHVIVVFALLLQGVLWWQWTYFLEVSSCESAHKQAQDPLAPSFHVKRAQPKRSSSPPPPSYNKTLVDSLARAFPRWTTSLPCFPAENDWDTVPALRRPIRYGFMYFKARKAGSSTLAGVALRIAKRIAKSRNMSICQTRFGHPPAWYLQYKQRDKANSFLWSVLREPTQRHVSEFFHFKVSREKVEPTDENFQQYFRDHANLIDNYYLNFLKVDSPLNRTHDNYTRVVDDILRQYNFIGILERLDESLVALQMILGLQTSDILYLAAKTNGGWDDGVHNGQCYYIVQRYISPTMQRFFDSSDYWYNYTRGDVLLYRSVNKSLHLTIQALGPDKFHAELQKFRQAMAIANSQCANITTYPCSPGGKLNNRHDCLWTDSGCGFYCLDRVAEQHLSELSPP